MTHLLDRPTAVARRLSGGPRRPRSPRPVPATPVARRPVPATRPADQTLTMVSTTASMLVLVSAWVLAQVLFLGGLSQEREQDRLYDELRGQLASATAPIGPVVPVGDPVALLSIPALGVEQVVVEGTASGDLLSGPGHQRNTVLPGQLGTAVVMGRAASYGGPFGDLARLRPDDVVETLTAQGRQVFTVLGVRRAGDPLPQPRPEAAARLLLVTAEGEGPLAAVSPSEVVYVDAEAREAFPTPAGLPAAVPDSEQAMATEPGALPLLALCLALLLAMTLGVIAARQRWSTALVWVVATPVVISLAWVSTDVVMRLLPNLL